MTTDPRLRPWRIFTWVSYLAGLGGLLAFTPIFNVGMSVAGFTIVGAWLVDWMLDAIEGHPWSRFQCFARNRGAQVIMAIFLLHAIGMIWTSDLSWGFHDLRVKLPLLFMPLIIGTMPRVDQLWFHRLMHLFLLALVFSTFTSLCVKWGWVDRPFDDIREITHKFITRVSHIRLSLLVVLGMAYAGIMGMRTPRHMALYIPLTGWLLFFLWSIESVTGLGMTVALMGFFLLRMVWTKATTGIRVAGLIGLAVLLGVSVFYVRNIAVDYFDTEQLDFATLESHSPDGERYFHDFDNRQIENGHFVWTYIAWGELAAGWNARSELSFEEQDARGQAVKATLIRYLTSKGLRKDKGGVASLTVEDQSKIEQGIASITEGQYGGLEGRIRQVLLEIDIYRNGGNPGGNSVTQRLEFWKTGSSILASHPIIGVGTGDVPDAFQKEYEAIDSPLAGEHRLRAHNQYLTMAVAFGIPGLLLFLFCLVYPAVRAQNWNNPIYLAFAVIAFLSFLTEDTLETQAGVTFYAFFQCFLLLGVQWTSKVSEKSLPESEETTS